MAHNLVHNTNSEHPANRHKPKHKLPRINSIAVANSSGKISQPYKRKV